MGQNSSTVSNQNTLEKNDSKPHPESPHRDSELAGSNFCGLFSTPVAWGRRLRCWKWPSESLKKAYIPRLNT